MRTSWYPSGRGPSSGASPRRARRTAPAPLNGRPWAGSGPAGQATFPRRGLRAGSGELPLPRDLHPEAAMDGDGQRAGGLREVGQVVEGAEVGAIHRDVVDLRAGAVRAALRDEVVVHRRDLLAL